MFIKVVLYVQEGGVFLEKASEDVLIGPYSLGDLVLIKAVSMLYPGLGRGGEVVDLPVQKDNLGFPIIFSSSFKGALKSTIWYRSKDLSRLLFGSEPEDTESYTSPIAVLDCFLLTIPARSLVGIYAYLTSPLLLERFNEYVKLVETVGSRTSEEAENTIKNLRQILDKILEKSKNLSRNQSLSSNPKLLEAKDFNSRIVINENLYLTYQQDENLEKLEKTLGIESGRLLVLHDDDALYAVERSLFRITRVRLERESKKVSAGPWTEEYIPRGTLFYSILLYSKPYGKVEAKNTKASDIRSKLKSFLKETEHYLIIGGNETIGRGIVKLIFLW